MPSDLCTTFAAYSKACRANCPSKTVLRMLEGYGAWNAATSSPAPSALQGGMGGRSPLAGSVASAAIETLLARSISCSTSASPAAGSPLAATSSVVIAAPPPAATAPLTVLDFSGKYVGNRSLVAVIRMLKDHVPTLEVLRLPNAGLFIGDGRPTNVSGNKVIAELCSNLEGHPSLREVDISHNDLGTNCYLDLVKFVKNTPSLERLVIDGCLFLPQEQEHLLALTAINAKRKQQLATNLSASLQYPGGKGKSPTAARRQSEYAGGARVGTKRIVSAGSDLHVIQYEPHPTKPGIVSASTVKDILSRKSRTYVAQLLSNIDAAHAQGGTAVKIPIQHPSMREYHKTPETAEALKHMLRNTVQFQAFQRIVFPSIPPPRSDRSSLGHPKSLDFGPTVEEREHAELVAQQAAQVDLVLEKLVASLQLAVYRNGEYVAEAGDVATFVFLVEQGQSGDGACEVEDLDRHLDLITVVAEARPGHRASSAGLHSHLSHFVELRGEDGEVALTYRPGTLFGETELLAQDGDTPPVLTRRMSAFARCPEGGNLRLWLLHKDVFHMYLADPIATSRAYWRRLVDAMPCLTTCPAQLRACLSDILVSTTVATKRSLSGETVPADQFKIEGEALSTHLVIVDEGLVGALRNNALVAELGRGDVFLLQRGASTAGLELAHIVGNMPSWKYCVVPLTELARLPKELWKFLAVTSRIYDGTNAAAVKALVDSQVSKLFIRTTRHPNKEPPRGSSPQANAK